MDYYLVQFRYPHRVLSFFELDQTLFAEVEIEARIILALDIWS